jgi:hypothetical protein
LRVVDNRGIAGCRQDRDCGKPAFGRGGLPDYQELLDYPITPGKGKVLYLAMDRPKQIGRSFRRMVGEAMRAELDEWLTCGQARHPLCRQVSVSPSSVMRRKADTVFLDSTKDAALKLSDDDAGAAYNRAHQLALHDGAPKLPSCTTCGRPQRCEGQKADP